MKFILTINQAKKPLGRGYLNSDENSASFFEETKNCNACIARIERPRLQRIGAEVMMISGFRLLSRGKTLRPRYEYEEWYLRENSDAVKCKEEK